MIHVGGRIRTLRTERGMTLPALAEKSGLSKGLLSKLENQESANPSLETLHRVTDALGVTLSQILDSGHVQANRVLPDTEPEWLPELTTTLKKEGKAVDQDILQALYVMQNRKGAAGKATSDWLHMYKSLALSFSQAGA